MRSIIATLLCIGACAHHAVEPTPFDRELAALPASGAHYAAPRDAKPLPLAPGQWVKQHVVDQDGHHTLVTTKVIGLFGHQVWLEREDEGATGTRVRKLLLSLGDRNDPGTIDIYQYWLKHPDGRVEQVSPMMLGAEKPRLQGELGALLIVRKPDAQEDIAVTAGHFARAYRARAKDRASGREVSHDTWWHSSVPFNGSLRSVGVGVPGGSELVAFGLSGAKSAF